ncbi:unnamed protein product [Ceratitis capitata]|uniref:phosphatidylinositol 3-kinase n=1 Tax=Ceratitis capitata TaxID=7213 RepID=A0A811V527_CERCA|nr:unnamed protein product [Ceratitis capitata]
MSNQSEVDYDKQFQDDLAKATALSLEQQALDDYRRAKKYGTAAHYYSEQRAHSQSPSLQHSHTQRQQSTESVVDYYAQLRARYQQSRGNSNDTAAPTATAVAPPIPPSRRHSEANNNISLNVAAVTAASCERSKTPPATLPESDLISFSSPTAKETQPSMFDKLIEDLQKLQTTSQQTALVPFGPVAAAPIAPIHAAAAAGVYRGTPPPMAAAPAHSAAAMYGAAGVGVPGANCMQLVPFTPALQQQKVPLTSEELQKLYNMPQQQQQQQQQQYYQQSHQHQQYMAAIAPVAGMVYPPPPPPARPGFVPSVGGFATPPPHAASFTQSAPATAAASAAYTPPHFPPTVSHYGFQYGALPASSSPFYTGTQAASMPLAKSQSAVAAIVPNGSGAATTGARRLSKAQRTGNDLIDLSQEDDSRVSVLEAFDPLLNVEGEGCDDDSDCTSYYAEYDPFDYLYSGGGTQYSDPVYEAVNKLEKSAVSPNVSSIGWRTDYLSRDDVLNSVAATTTSSSVSPTHFLPGDHSPSGSRSPPPPLPPRNSGSRSPPFPHSGLYPTLRRDNSFESSTSVGISSSAAAGSSHATSSPFGRPSAATLDRRKTNGTRLYEVVTDRRTVDSELLEFFFMVKELRMRYLYNDTQTNPGHVIASEFNYHYPLETSIKILVHPALKALLPSAEMAARTQGQVKGYGVPVVFTCDINTAVELVIDQAFCSLEGQIKGTPNDYVVKPIGVSEWLSPSSKLSQLECVHNSLKLEQDVQLGLCVKSEENMQVIARTQGDDSRDTDLRAEDILPNEMAATINYDNMMILIETLETEIDKLECADPNSRSILSCSGVVQAVKAICALLGSIDTLEISACIADLKRICEEGQVKYASHSTETNPEIVSERGDYAEVRLVPRPMLDQIKLKCNQLRDAVQELIELYSNVFRVGFSVKSLDYSTTPMPISCVLKPIVVSINCLHRPPPTWRYDDYSLGVQIVYGTRFVSDPIVTKCSNDMSGGLFPRLNFSSWLTFEKNPICTLPREARLIFVLYGTQTAENEQNTDANGERRQVPTELGWCAIQLFDQKREMICGSYLLSMWPPTTDKFLGPAPARGCHPQPDICPVLSIEVPPYGGRIMFPEPVEQPAPAPRYDFNSLDANLQQDLLDTAEQGYSGAKDKREVFWEKRLYLQSFPYALPKVLHAAHSWDYASLIDLHSLLHSWTPLSPLQALELLLPRYPDAKVRERAVEWISHLPNDQLVDYLPQLLQALKHDTYEASAMARFLLCKCLESPRIAHHMYWLLVHSLPGDDPQNSIDASSVANEFDESLITQARYYRRNKMMLRALLAICGEKLLARFLSQNMMCKSLARLAESVKEAKESLRQKTLCFGMETVHQQLGDKPTSLPLGPELEVTGVNVRSCSYFNSNTLPLKISYIGSDGEILPAIFKSGDDLQQDMLTIQLIRVMNKMWLAEGLDLKMVTFNCVPTGFKKGMIELVSDAETLRKIQVEYGLTGSFKDRPIAEWLAKQNPSQLEYQRAVKNFTVSCAGYSVATYILGICDRHNDNIMLKTSGHLFHIDFGKFLGDAQMFGNFKRDRTPFVLTSDMAYVINGGDKPSTDFHYFVDLCCRAFNIIRKHGDLILHMLALMATAGIPGVTADAVTYVRGALLPEQSNPEAAASFAKMIQFSLKSWFTQFNFFLHNLAQMRFSNDEGSGELLSFVPRKYTMQQDGRLKSVMVVRCQKHYDTEKYYTYILRVTRHGQTDPTHLFRSYKEFTEFHQKLCLHFPLAKLHR